MKTVFIITQQTKAIIAKGTYSIILNGDKEYFSIYNPEQILDNSCIIYGSTLVGRRKSIKDMFNFNSKIPVPVNPMKGVYMFPTSSTKNKDCVWLSFYQIKFYDQINGQTYIGFEDGTGLYVKASKSTIDMQHKRTSQIIAKMNRSLFFGSTTWINPFPRF